MSDGLLPVTQADRDAVQAFHRIQGERLMRDLKNGTDTLSAKGDDTDTIYQAFARHRLETIEQCAQEAYRWWDGEPEDAEELRIKIRALAECRS